MTDLVIFDCDGVLLDSEPVSCRVEAETLSAAGFPITPEEIAGRFVGRPSATMFQELERDFGRAVPADLQEEIGRRVRESLIAEPVPIPGMADLLHGLGDRTTCIASSSDPVRLEASLAAADLLRFFHRRVFSAVEVERGKPAPDLFLHAAASMGAEPRRCVVVEDSPAGVLAGVAASMRVIGFTGGSHCGIGHDQRLRAAGAATVVDDATALAAALAA
jgi:HAD superfamily hydrolase (TIGR01509 family)